MMAKKLRTLSDVGLRSTKTKNFKPTLDLDQDNKDMFSKLMTYSLYWSEMREIRERRARTRNYLFGKQWSDKVVVDGITMTEEEYIKRQGRVPLANNQIQQIAKNIIGGYRQNPAKALLIPRAKEKQSVAEMQQNALEACKSVNKAEHMDAALLRESIISGAMISKVGYHYMKEQNRKDVSFENVNINRFFMNTDIEDPRMRDLRTCGQFIDMSEDKAISIFAQNKDDETVIRDWFRRHSLKDSVQNTMNSAYYDSMDFFAVPDNNKVRVFECWELKAEWRLQVHDQLNGSYETVSFTPELERAIQQQNEQRMT